MINQMADWDALPEGIMIEIAERIGVYDDFEAMDMVSHRWKSARRMAKYGGKSPQVPWMLMIPDEDSDNPSMNHHHPRLYSLSKQHAINITLPDRTDQEQTCSSRGWLLAVSRGGTAASLMNPVSGAQFPLPAISSIGECIGVGHFFPINPRVSVGRFALSCSPSSNPDSFEIMMIINTCYWPRLVLWRPGDTVWTPLSTPRLRMGRHDEFSDVAYCGGEFVAITFERDIVVCKVNPDAWRRRRRKEKLGSASDADCKESKEEEEVGQDDLVRLRFVANLSTSLIFTGTSTPYLVVLDDENDKLLVVAIRYVGARFMVVEFDLVEGEFTEVKDLGNKSIFLGQNEGLCIKASLRYGCKPNCIYYWEDAFGLDIAEVGMAVFNLADGTIEFPYRGKSFDQFDPLLWIEPRI